MCPTAIEYDLDSPLSNEALNALFAAAWPGHQPRAFGSLLAHSLVTVAAHAGSRLIGFVHVAWDGGIHGFLLDPTVHPDYRRRGIGRRLVALAAEAAATRGIDWLHVDYVLEQAPFYAACGFRPTAAGLLWLQDEAIPHEG
jgi:ribosomal protein S18 acetylase RimI-like enzyme